MDENGKSNGSSERDSILQEKNAMNTFEIFESLM